ncbi:MAG TPA: zinc-binding alcohol dehydrogenase [Beijerinckiaceae bacterium]|jgi:NADPH:quinone reductase-like Zn-dependent oxidoreductase
MNEPLPQGRTAAQARAARSRALWYVARGRAELRESALPAPGPGQALVRTAWSTLSRGTERLVFEGRVPLYLGERMRAPMQEGEFPHPVKYGYCAVGTVEDGPDDLAGRTVFALHPHQDAFMAPAGDLAVVPADVPPRRAVLAANMETALNALWDSGAGPGDRIVVVGAGVVGLLAGYLSACLPGAEVTMVDIDLSREEVAAGLGCRFRKPLDAPGKADVVFHASATSEGLACALACAGREATVVEMSWYGDAETTAPLGLNFHGGRLKLVSSQVGEVSPSRRPRWTHRRRLDKALALLADVRLDVLVTEEIAFADLPAALPRLLARGAPGLATAVRYDPVIPGRAGGPSPEPINTDASP